MKELCGKSVPPNPMSKTCLRRPGHTGNCSVYAFYDYMGPDRFCPGGYAMTNGVCTKHQNRCLDEAAVDAALTATEVSE